MKFSLRPSTPNDAAHVIDIWRRSVDATHHFLDPRDRAAMDSEVATFLATAPLTLAVDASDRPIGFMLARDGNMDALFIDPDHHKQGAGKALVAAALTEHPQLTTDVNEQNTAAAAFYQRLGFAPTGRSDQDGQGRPYPLIHLRYEPKA